MNFSARSEVGTGPRTLVVGFVVNGENKPVLLRGIGPTLGAFGITRPLAEPVFQLFQGGRLIASGDSPAAGARTPKLADQPGAFRLNAGASDKTLSITLVGGAYTARLAGANESTGVGLLEVYDADTATSAMLSNVSVLTEVQTGEHALRAGFVIAGPALKQLLIRGIGPTLAQFGLRGMLGAPAVRLYSGQSLVAENVNWGRAFNASQISTAAGQVGAFPLLPGSADAALLVSLPPGAYTVEISDVNRTPGVALVEIYGLP